MPKGRVVLRIRRGSYSRSKDSCFIRVLRSSVLKFTRWMWALRCRKYEHWSINHNLVCIQELQQDMGALDIMQQNLFVIIVLLAVKKCYLRVKGSPGGINVSSADIQVPAESPIPL